MSSDWPAISARSRRRAAPSRASPPASRAAAAPDWPGRERVAGQDRARHAEHGPGRRPVPALLVAVHDVVVQQREVVDELDRDRAVDRRLRRRADGRRRGRARAGTHRLAAAGAVLVPAEVVDGDRAQIRLERVDGRAQGRPDELARAVERLGERRGHAATPRLRRSAQPDDLARRRDAAAHRALHRRGPAGVGPRAGEVEAVDRGARAAAAAPRCPGPGGRSPAARA